MASATDFIIRCRTEKGSFLIKHLNSESTVGELKMHLSQVMHTEPESVKILCGDPPTALAEDIDNLTLDDVNIQFGEIIVIEVDPKTMQDGSSFEQGFLADSAEITGGEAEVRVNPSNDFEDASAGYMVRHEVPDNDSCLFSSIYFVISNGDFNTKKINKLRKVIADAVSGNPEKYNLALLGMSNEVYCSWIQNKRSWGGAIELEIFSEHFRIEIVAVDICSLKMHRFGEKANYSDRVFLIYNGVHYDPLVLRSESGNLQTAFPVSDDRPMQMAMEIAKEAKSSGQNNDFTHYTHRCMTCDMVFRGNRGARVHAAASGHNKFEEIAKKVTLENFVGSDLND